LNPQDFHLLFTSWGAATQSRGATCRDATKRLFRLKMGAGSARAEAEELYLN